MARFHGEIGFLRNIEEDPVNRPGIYVEKLTKRTYSGDALSNSRRWDPSGNLNDNLTINNRIRVVADGWIGDRKTVMEGVSAIIYDEAANYPGKAGMKLTINGGTITGIDHSIQVRSNELTPQVFVNGGNLTPVYPEPEQEPTPEPEEPVEP